MVGGGVDSYLARRKSCGLNGALYVCQILQKVIQYMGHILS
jgi:hypothetical protein